MAAKITIFLIYIFSKSFDFDLFIVSKLRLNQNLVESSIRLILGREMLVSIDRPTNTRLNPNARKSIAMDFECEYFYQSPEVFRIYSILTNLACVRACSCSCEYLFASKKNFSN